MGHYYREYDKDRGCIICNGAMPTDRRLTCSMECYRLFVAQKVELRGRAPFYELPKQAAQELRRHNRIVAQQTGKYARVCIQCGTKFLAKTTRTFWCSPACQVMKTDSCSMPSVGPSKPTLKGSEFERHFEPPEDIDPPRLRRI